MYRDWMFWMTVTWATFSVFAMALSPEPSPMPLWFDVVFGTLFMTALFGLLPAGLRLLIRRWLWRRQRNRSTSPMSPDRAAAPVLPTAPSAGADGSSTWIPLYPRTPPFIDQGTTALRDYGPNARSSREDLAMPRNESSAGLAHDVLAEARADLPHPVARAVHLVELAYRPKDQYDAVINASEILAATLVLTSAGLIRCELERSAPSAGFAYEKARSQLSHLRSVFMKSGPTFGTWTAWVTQLEPLLEASPSTVPGFLEALRPSRGNEGLAYCLKSLKDERNRASHGNKPRTQEEAALRIESMAEPFNRALLSSRFLADLPWLMTVSSEYRSLERTFDVEARHVMGNNPDFERRTFEWSQPTAVKTMYVLTHGGPVPLSPLVASRFCLECKQHELCFTYKLDKQSGHTLLKSFASGHEIRDSDLTKELSAFLLEPDCDRSSGRAQAS